MLMDYMRRSITHGNAHQHAYVWTFSNGYDGLADTINDQFNCPCASGSEYLSPPFVGTN